ncbi:competence/damage-inducible protein A [Ruminococcaceae bacterium OttesenSCG-928-I18]|nr:competence/damage-inducible protein A [Ruminococcaceae bacterium OttesenSCG-928-I18]
MRAEIISVGTELLLGDIVNTNAQYLSRELASLGFTVYYQSVVGDNPVRLRQLVHEAKQRSDVLLFTGGLGPTEDDLTKETVAEAYGDSLILDAEELSRLESFFASLGRTMAPGNRKQAMVPRRGRKLDNPNGTAPGAYFRQGSKYAFLLPGPPREMKPMFENEVRPLLEEMQEGAIRSRTLRVVGIGESDLEEMVMDLLSGSNPTAALYAKEGEVHIRVTAQAATAEQADYMCNEMARLFETILGDAIYSDDDGDLSTTVVRLLTAKGETVALAESCTGGLLAERITSVPGSSQVFGYGAVSYANEFKRRMLGVRGSTLRRYGAVSSQVAAEMAFGAAKKGEAEYGIGITGIAGPDGGTEEKPVGLVYVGVSVGKRVFIRKLLIANRERDFVRIIATQHALDMLRRAVLGLEIPQAKEFKNTQYADYERQGRPRRHGGLLLRAFVAIVLIAALFVVLVVGIYYLQRGNAALSGAYPTAQGLQYGTPEYERAAQSLIKREKEQNPAVTGFIALPGGLVEEFVALGQAEQADLPKALDRPGSEGFALISADASPLTAASNTMMAGGGALRAMLELGDTERAGEISTFTYFTENDVQEYQVFAAAYLDDAESQPDGFDPAFSKLESYDDYLTFLLGAKGRSLYTTEVQVEEDDRFMTLQTEDPAVPGRRFFLFGRMSRPGEDSLRAHATPAGVPLMPSAYYDKAELPQPDFDGMYERWLRSYLTGGVDNTDLQLRAGMPQSDSAPYIEIEEPVPEEEEAEVPAGEEAAEEAAEAPAQEETPVTVTQALRRSAPAPAALYGDAQPSPTTEGAAAAGGESLAAGAAASSSASSSQSSAAAAPASNATGAASSTSASGNSATASSPSSSASQAPSSQASSSQDSSSQSGEETSSSMEQAPSEPQTETTILRPDPRFLLVRLNGVLVRDTTTNVLAAICQKEVAGKPDEVIKAQAIAVHSWILNQQGGGNPAPSVRGESPSIEMRQLVEEVNTLVLSEDETNPAFAPWFQMAAGGTNPSADLWGKPREYLTAVETSEEEGFADHKQMLSVPYEELEALVTGHLGIPLEELGEPHSWFSEIEKNESGYVVSLQIGQVQLSGLEFWQHFLVREGVPILPSPAFEVEFSGDEFLFTVYGQGHGCGLSQMGAAAHAENEGWDYSQILGHYYPGTEIMEWE